MREFLIIGIFNLTILILPIFSLSAQDNAQSSTGHMRGIFDEALYLEPAEKLKETAVLIDDFESASKFNLLKGITNVYMMPPARVMLSTVQDEREGKPTNVLRLKFSRRSDGGPYGKGGWCGYYSSIKTISKLGAKYFDASNYEYLTFWVKGETGNENFIIGLADKHWDKAGDSIKSNEVISYLDEEQITNKWQKAKIPLSDFLIDISKLSSLAICFEAQCFPEGDAEGVVYIDDIAFE
ncbi:hypothetical protein J7L67_06615 [bacterium]|nr:hypothetical protein [bacterium]